MKTKLGLLAYPYNTYSRSEYWLQDAPTLRGIESHSRIAASTRSMFFFRHLRRPFALYFFEFANTLQLLLGFRLCSCYICLNLDLKIGRNPASPFALLRRITNNKVAWIVEPHTPSFDSIPLAQNGWRYEASKKVTQEALSSMSCIEDKGKYSSYLTQRIINILLVTQVPTGTRSRRG